MIKILKSYNTGFTNIQYFKDGKIENIDIPQPENIPKRSLKLLTKCYLDEKENLEFTKLPGSLNVQVIIPCKILFHMEQSQYLFLIWKGKKMYYLI
ncbi:MAG: hypothetical protein RCG15_00805 [Candidatus Rickettsia vulgarisii]